MTDQFLALAGIRSVLFDLDGTLLRVEMNEFIPGWIGELADYFAPGAT